MSVANLFQQEFPDTNLFEHSLEYVSRFLNRFERFKPKQEEGSELLGWHAHTDLPFRYYAYQEKIRTILSILKEGPDELTVWEFFSVSDRLRECAEPRLFYFNAGTKSHPISRRSLAIAIHTSEFF